MRETRVISLQILVVCIVLFMPFASSTQADPEGIAERRATADDLEILFCG